MVLKVRSSRCTSSKCRTCSQALTRCKPGCSPKSASFKGCSLSRSDPGVGSGKRSSRRPAKDTLGVSFRARRIRIFPQRSSTRLPNIEALFLRSLSRLSLEDNARTNADASAATKCCREDPWDKFAQSTRGCNNVAGKRA